jgi:ATP-dependent protease HslVU (ClpYQ) peptidase subunit
MTCIIGLLADGIVHMGGDDIITAEADLLQKGASKVVRYPSGLVAGFAGSLATSNILSRPDDAFIKALTDLESDAAINTAFDRLQSVAGFELKGTTDGQFWTMVLVAMGGSLVCMGNVAGWYRVKDFRCIGTGGKIATGAMTVLARVDGVSLRRRLETAIEAAAIHVPGVGRMTSYETTSPSAPQGSPARPQPAGPPTPDVP